MTKRKDGFANAWSWAEDFSGQLTQENIETSYRLNLKLHSASANVCRKNCRTNPSCLTGFGEAHWNQPIKDDVFSEQRAPGSFAGLKNLGNTCYINCLLQLWFHNVPLREAVYLWNALGDKVELLKHIEAEDRLISADDYHPLSCVAHLQALFAEMEFGLRKYCDPTDFCKSLSIDVELQQDAQEFGKLYMSLLEETLARSDNEVTQNVIRNQFRGKYAYTTTCSRCKKVSRRPSYFYELELSIKGRKTILDSLDDYVKVESLADDNKYDCSNCNSKQDAETRTELLELPPVLQLQLIRYYYDMASSTKKKITQNIMFPDVLDLSPYLGKPAGAEMYSLHALLMHGGGSANSGHYYAHIKTEDGWHLFDDDKVKKQKMLSLIDEPLKTNPVKKNPPNVKGFRSSPHAYMLVYAKIPAETVVSQSAGLEPVAVDSTDPAASPLNQSSQQQKSPLREKEEKLPLKQYNSPKCISAMQQSIPRDKTQNDSSLAREVVPLKLNDLPPLRDKKPLQLSDENVVKAEADTTVRKKYVEPAPAMDEELLKKEVYPQLSQKTLQNEAQPNGAAYGEEEAPSTANPSTIGNLFPLIQNQKVEVESPVDKVREVALQLEDRSIKQDPAALAMMNGENDMDELVNNFQHSDMLHENSDLVTDPDTGLGFECSPEEGEIIPSPSDMITDGGDLDSANAYKESPRKKEDTGCGDDRPVSNDHDIYEGKHNDDLAHRGDGDDDPPDGSSIELPPTVHSDLARKHWNMMPQYLKKYVTRRNEIFMKSCQSQIDEVESKLEHQRFIQDFTYTMPPDPLRPSEFIAFSALTNLVKGLDVPPLDNSGLLCVHGCLDVEKVKEYKQVSSEAVEMYVTRFGGGPRISITSLCHECVTKRALETRAHAMLMADVKIANALLKAPLPDDQPAYWLGKKSLNKWWKQVDCGSATSNLNKDYDIMDEGESCPLVEVFNSDITCPHGELCIDENDRRLGPAAFWKLLVKYFPNIIHFPRNRRPCQLCLNEAQQTDEQLRLRARNEKLRLQSLFSEKRESPSLEGDVYLVSAEFVSAWRRYTRSAGNQVLKERPDPCRVFDPLLCTAHKLLVYNPNTDLERFCVVTATEWEAIRELYELTMEIRLIKQKDCELTASIDVCGDCMNERISVQEQVSTEKSYYGARLYVHKVSNEVDEEVINSVPPENKKVGVAKKRKNTTPNSPTNPPSKKPLTDIVRRSARSRLSRDDKLGFTIDKYTTLKNLKLMIYERLGVMPSDQHLSLNGEDLDDLKTLLGLSDEEATFVRLEVPPESVLRLLADEPCPDLDDESESARAEPETGFHGTELGGR